MMKKLSRVLGVVLLSALMTACANKPVTLYQWQGYQGNVDEYFRGDKSSPAEQLQKMETDLQKIQTSGAAVPPGYYAHMGLLYGQQGRLDEFADKIQTEKKQYPESDQFMSFLLRNFKK